MQTYKDVYPEGTYKVRAMGMILTESKTTGNPYLKVKVEVIDSKKVDSSEEIVYGGHRYLNLYLSEKKLDETREVLNAAGLASAGVESVEDFDIQGFVFIAKCKNEEWDGKPQDKFELNKYWNIEPTVSTGWMEKIAPVSRVKAAGINSMLGLAKQGWKPAAQQNTTEPRRSAF